jgi:hypothetical protein
VRLEGSGKMKKKKNSLTSSWIELATFPLVLVAQCLNYLRYRVPHKNINVDMKPNNAI